MFFKKKEIYRQIHEYGKNTEFLRSFAKFTKIEKIQDVSREHLKTFYIEFIEPISSMYFKIESCKYINKFLKEYGVPFVLKMEEVVEFTPNHDIIEAMRTVSRFNPTRKAHRNKLIVNLIDKKRWSLAEVAAEVGLRAKSTVHEIYWREKKRQEVEA